MWFWKRSNEFYRGIAGRSSLWPGTIRFPFDSEYPDHSNTNALTDTSDSAYYSSMPKMIILECAFCTKLFERKEKSVKWREKNFPGCHHFCSLACAASKPGTRTVACFTCGANVVLTPSHRLSKSGNYFCSRRCAAITNNKIYKRKENHPNWNGGKASYRYGRKLTRCSECGETRYYLLTVNHKDGDRSNNAPENLEDLCANCHITRHLTVRNGRLVVRWGMMTSDEAKDLMDA